MSDVFVHGWGAVSPAGWGATCLRQALNEDRPAPTKDLLRPGWAQPMPVRGVPPPSPGPSPSLHPRLRRASPIGQYAVAAALEALGSGWTAQEPNARLGIILCAMSGCVNYTKRFYDEALRDPATASPLIFPETVFNAPASHLAALLKAPAITYTLVGDPGTFLQGLALAADWLVRRRVEGCVVIGAEELDWIVTEAFRMFDHTGIASEGAGALYLRCDSPGLAGVELRAITHPHLFSSKQNRLQAAVRARAELNGASHQGLLCDGIQGVRRLDAAELGAWGDWAGPRLSPKRILGEAFVAAAAWQCVAAVDMLAQNCYTVANVSVIGCNQQAIAAQFARTTGHAASDGRSQAAPAPG